MKKSISVIIPVFNRESLLPLTLKSLLAQTCPADEIIVVDDGSTDSTVSIAESFGGTVRVIRQANAGPAAARNRGFKESQGEFIHFFDSDDLALPNKHEVQLDVLERSGADIAYGPWVKGEITESGFNAENHVLQQLGLPKGDLIRALLTNWSIVPHACLFRRSIVEKVGGFPEELFVAEDQLMFLRCLLAGAKVMHSPETLELYRSNDAGKITASDPASKARHFREWGRFLAIARNECLDKGIDPQEWFGFRQRAWQVELDLKHAGIRNEELISGLQAINRGGLRRLSYFSHRSIRRKLEGIQQRLTGGRAHTDFQIGPLTENQLSGIERIFQKSESGS
ncbi:MAG: glycosyltransferase family 2 protein [Verrucomicrobiae bacterium]|nr:glycosyltransferase family 2 protein [Verrucomicrobiae bacterium]NNJ44015.1 glycosyltransferase family 2 protein [Akkermansiaceae bacterium]